MNLKENILAELLSHEGEYYSGGKLAEKFGVSRTAIWKVMEQLKQDGCQIEAVSHKGYFLTKKPDLFNQKYMLDLLKNCKTNWQIQHFKTLDSTNRVAKELAGQNAPSGTVVIADFQTSGRGRMGKHFYSPKGGLYLSVIEKLDLPISDMMSVTACTATAVFLALKQFGITSQIKWVNDLFLNNKKICGILSEGSFNAELLKMDYLVIGIGINLHADKNRPEELNAIITDLETETGNYIYKYDLAIAILKNLETMLAEISEHSYLKIYTENSYTLGHRIQTDDGRQGIAIGFSQDAGLIIKLDDNTETILRTGSAKIID